MSAKLSDLFKHFLKEHVFSTSWKMKKTPALLQIFFVTFLDIKKKVTQVLLNEQYDMLLYSMARVI